MASELKILLVDDFEMVRFGLRSTLADLGFTHVEEAENGQIGIDMMKDCATKNAPYSIVLCDWAMPEVNGLEVLRFARKHDVYKSIPFVMLTAEAEQSSVVEAFQEGVTEYWVKPIAPDALEIKLNKLIAGMKKRSA